MFKNRLILLFSLFFIFPLGILFVQQPGQVKALDQGPVVYYSRACSGCEEYLSQLTQFLNSKNIKPEQKDYINNIDYRAELTEMNQKSGVPNELQGHMATFLPSAGTAPEIILQGHVPLSFIETMIDSSGTLKEKGFQKVLVYQDIMHGEARYYKAWAGGEIRTYSIDEPITKFLEDWAVLKQSSLRESSWLLPTVLTSGFLDGLNPCAFAVLLFLIAFIFMLRKSRLAVFKMSLLYIGAIYLTYLLIGLGIWKVFLFTGQPHLMARIGSYLVIGLGLVNVLNFIFPKMPFSLRIPMPTRVPIMELMHKGTVPATLLLGVLVGLCTFPCSGGIYVAIIGLLAAKTTAFLGFSYLLLYNFMFILPLFIILALASNRIVVEKLTNWEEKKEPVVRLAYGLTMIGVGISILIWFI